MKGMRKTQGKPAAWFIGLVGVTIAGAVCTWFLFLSSGGEGSKTAGGAEKRSAEEEPGSKSRHVSTEAPSKVEAASPSLIGKTGKGAASGSETGIRDLVLSDPPPEILERLEFRIISNNLKIAESLKRHFGLSDPQFEQVVSAVEKSSSAIRELEFEEMEIIRENDGATVFHIPSFDGGNVKETLKAELEDAMGEKLTDFFLMKAEHAFSQNSGNFGELPRLVQVRLLSEEERPRSRPEYLYEIHSLVLPKGGGHADDLTDPALFTTKRWVASKRTTEKFAQVPERFRHLIGN